EVVVTEPDMPDAFAHERSELAPRRYFRELETLLGPVDREGAGARSRRCREIQQPLVLRVEVEKQVVARIERGEGPAAVRAEAQNRVGAVAMGIDLLIAGRDRTIAAIRLERQARQRIRGDIRVLGFD